MKRDQLESQPLNTVNQLYNPINLLSIYYLDLMNKAPLMRYEGFFNKVSKEYEGRGEKPTRVKNEGLFSEQKKGGGVKEGLSVNSRGPHKKEQDKNNLNSTLYINRELVSYFETVESMRL